MDQVSIPDRYIGDGVYASFDGYYIWLDTRAQEPINKIALEPTVVVALARFVEDVTADVKASLPPAAPDE